ncbi:MAG: UDP-N-acetylglucosamine 2-epimerase (non-hydrolyzing) [Actinomycetota bacterium]|nr:UDP-N-acetylglucosamine 2-epimerase (non-hydrolyzing) [Actinomycetota bacterium]
MCVVGARPNFMKVKPVIAALERRGMKTALVHTGQHYDHNMDAVFFDELGLRDPDRHLGVGSGSQAQQTAGVMIALEPILDEFQPDVVVVVGDVNSTLGAALVTAKSGARLAHVEAGLRSGDWTMPEEVNRVVTDRLSDFLFAPSQDAVDNLRSEGCADERIHLVGNVMIDTVVDHLDRAADRSILGDLGLNPHAYGLVTLHRPANVEPMMLKQLVQALEEVAKHCPLLLAAHPRTQRELCNVSGGAHLRVVPPLGYLDFLALQRSARLVLTDSGGIQEETTFLGVPCLTLRETTERPITVREGTNKVVGREPDRIVDEALRVLHHGVPPRRPPLWDGHAAERIAAVLAER